MNRANNLNILFTNRELLWAWTSRTVRARYKQSLLGGLWVIIQPAARAAILTIIFTQFIPIDTGDIPYIIFSYSAMVPWTFFSSALMDMVTSVVINAGLVGKIYFPREILPIATLLARLLDFFIAALLLIIMMIFYRMPVFTVDWLLIPVILMIQILLSLGIGFGGAALNVYYRDIHHLFTFGIQLWFYATPIIYPVTQISDNIKPFYFLNPMAGVIEAFRAVLFSEPIEMSYLLISAGMSLVIFVVGYVIFKRLELHFADTI